MAQSQVVPRPRQAGKPRSLRKRNSSFPIETGPLSSNQRDVSRIENCRRRALLEQSKDSFQTYAYRTEPTMGEEELEKYSTPRASSNTSRNQQDAEWTNYTGKERLVQSMVPDCFFYIQDFHHYRNDIEKMICGQPVPYLTRGKESNIAECKTVYATKSHTAYPHIQTSGRSGYFGALPARSYKSATTFQRLPTEAKLSSPGARKASNTDQPKKQKDESFNTKASKVEQQKREGSVVPGLLQQRLENETGQIPCASFQSIQSELLPPGPVTTPDAVSRRSSVATFLTSLDDVNVCVGNAFTKNADGSNVQKLYFPPFVPRFPHMKAVAEWGSRREEAKREKRARTPGTPAWQQYRVLCDAFRPCDTGDFVRRSMTGQERRRFATSFELQYYFDVLRDMNMYPQSC